VWQRAAQSGRERQRAAQSGRERHRAAESGREQQRAAVRRLVRSVTTARAEWGIDHGWVPGGGVLRETDHWGDQGVCGRVTLIWMLGSGMWGMDWIELGQDREMRRML
jgi:hypothetical protein